MDRMQRISDSIDELDPFSDERDAFATTILGGSIQLQFDSEGRIIIPKDLIDQLAIDDQAIFVGKGDVFEIWEPSKFQVHMAKTQEIASQKRLSLRLKKKEEASSN